jgi:glycine cleavage system H protein
VQEELGDVVFVDLPEVGRQVAKGESFGVVESVKAASDIYSPISGEVVAVNSELAESPALVNKGPFDEGWIMKVKLKDDEEVCSLLGAEKYRQLLEVSTH